MSDTEGVGKIPLTAAIRTPSAGPVQRVSVDSRHLSVPVVPVLVGRSSPAASGATSAGGLG